MVFKSSSYDIIDNRSILKNKPTPDDSIVLTNFTQPVRQTDDFNILNISPVSDECVSYEEISLSSQPNEKTKGENKKKKWTLIVSIIFAFVIFLVILLIVIWILYASNVFNYYY